MLLDLLCGLVLVALAFFDARVLLQSPALIYLLFPLLCTAAFLIGFWRKRLLWTPILATLPLWGVAVYFFSGRNKPLILFPIAATICVVIGALVSQWKTALAILIVMNAAVAFAGPPFVGLLTRTQTITEKAVPFTIELVDGRRISSQELRGRVVVLDFWATWCVPCQHELPAVQRFYEKTKGRSDVAVFAVDGVMADTPGAGDTAERAIESFRRGGYTIPLAFDRDGVLEKQFSLAGFPALLILDAGGQVRMRHTGYVGSEDLEAVLMRTVDQLALR